MAKDKTMATALPGPKGTAPAASLDSRLKRTGMNHIYYLDILGDGRLREVALVKVIKDPAGAIQTVYYIDVMLLDQVDKSRMKGIITGQHADKYELWDLLSQQTLSNGKNALDYFHQMVRSINGPGAVNTSLGGGLATVRADAESSTIIGQEFSPDGRLDTGTIDAQPA